MINWRECKLEDLVVFQRGHDLPQTAFEDGPYLVAGSNGPIGYHKKFTTKGPGITLGRSGNSVGVVHYYPKDFWAHNTTLYSKQFKDADPLFLYYFFKTIDLASYDAGSAVPTLNRNHIHPITVSVPIIEIQRSIAEALKSFDDKIDLLHQQNQTLEQMAETLYRQWFHETAGSDWQEDTLQNHIEVYRGLSYKGSGLCEGLLDGAIPMLNLNTVFEGGSFKAAGIKYYNGGYKDRHIVKPGDLIVANTEQGHEHRLIGFSAIVPHSIGPKAIFSQHIYRVVPKSNSISSLYLHYALKTPAIRDQVTGATNRLDCKYAAPGWSYPMSFIIAIGSIDAKIHRHRTGVSEQNRAERSSN